MSEEQVTTACEKPPAETGEAACGEPEETVETAEAACEEPAEVTTACGPTKDPCEKPGEATCGKPVETAEVAPTEETTA